MAIIQDLLVKLGFHTDPEGLERANHHLEGINHKLEILAGVEIAKGLYEIVEHFSGFADSLEQAAYQAGVTTTDFQKLVYAGSQFNVSQEQMQGGLAKLSRLLQNARDGSKGAIEQFEKIGITPEQLQQFGNAEEAFMAIQDALSQIPDTFRRVAATQAIFGRGSVGLTKFASAGSKATIELGNEAERMGAVVAKQGVESLGKFEEAMKALGLTTKGIMGTIAGAFAPAITAVVKDVQGFIGTNKDLIAQNLDGWSRRIAYGLGYVVEIIRLVASDFRAFIDEHPKLLAWGLKTAGILITMSLAGSALKFIFAGLKGAISLVTAAVGLMGSEAVITLAVVAGLALGLKALWDVAHGKSFSDTALYKGFMSMKDYATETVGVLKEGLGALKGPDLELGDTPKRRVIPTREWQHMTHEQRQQAQNDRIGADNPFSMMLPGLQLPNMDSLADGMKTINQAAVRRGEGVAGDTRTSTQNVNVSAPITMNVTGVADAAMMQSMQASMEKAAQQVFTQVAQRTHRDHLPAAAR